MSSPKQSTHSSTTYDVEEVVTTVREPVVRPKPAFLSVLRLAGGTGETFTITEIIGLVKTYIEERKLHDQLDPRIINCQNDLLGTALNVTSFPIHEALKHFWASCSLTPDSCLRIKRHVVATPVEPQSHGGEKSKSSSAGQSGPVSDRLACPSLSLSSSASSLSSTVQTTPPAVQSVTKDALSVSASQPSSSTLQTCDVGRLTASQPSTSISQKDLDEYEQKQGSNNVRQDLASKFEDQHKPSTSSLSVLCDETDGVAPLWSCQVMVERHDPPSQQRVRNHDSFVLECTPDSFSVEYELVSSSDAELVSDRLEKEESEGSSSSLEAAEVLLVCQESDIEYLADYSDSDSDSDAELSNEDKWQCHYCKFKNCALYRNCEKCWGIRPDWLPVLSGSSSSKNLAEDECGKNGGLSVAVEHPNNATNNDECFVPCITSLVGTRDTAGPFEGAAVVVAKEHSLNPVLDSLPSQEDSAISSLVSSQENHEKLSSSLNKADLHEYPHSPVQDDSKSKHKKRKNTEFSSDWSDSNEASVLKKSKKGMGRDLDPKSSDPCVICLTRSKTASIIHGKTGHQVCCYRCARRLKHQRKSCPICRRPIQKVIRNFF